MLEQFREYYRQAKLMQEFKFQGGPDPKGQVDDLVYNVPIYDVVNRRFAAFSSFTEAIWYKEKDPKGNGKYWNSNTVPRDENFASLCYLFRLCGSGINYIPNTEGGAPHGTHGFGNFWVVESISGGRYRRDSWLDDCPNNKFADVKGYMLPMLPKDRGGLRGFIVDGFAYQLVGHVWNFIQASRTLGKRAEIFEVVEAGNAWLTKNGYMRQNFVLCAFAMDLAEYFPDLVDPNSRVLVGSNARKCLKLIFPTRRGIGTNLDNTNEALEELCEITGGYSKKYDMEDVACDFIRYINNYQSPDHIKANNGIEYVNKFQK